MFLLSNMAPQSGGAAVPQILEPLTLCQHCGI